MAENERLAVLESQYVVLQVDVTEIKKDVKAIAAAQSVIATALAVKTASENAAMLSRSNTGVWARSIVPWILVTVSLLLTIINTLKISFGVTV